MTNTPHTRGDTPVIDPAEGGPDLDANVQPPDTDERPAEQRLRGRRLYFFIIYNLVLAGGLGAALIVLVAWGEYAEVTSVGSVAISPDVLLSVLITMTVAGAAGGVLCNLRGLFKHCSRVQEGARSVTYTRSPLASAAREAGAPRPDVEQLLVEVERGGPRTRTDGGFPSKLEIPFYVRPLTGAMTGLFTFFVASFLVSSLSLDFDTSSQNWTSLPGRIPFIAVAFLAGFAAQEFMERLKEVAKTLFSQNDRNQRQDD